MRYKVERALEEKTFRYKRTNRKFVLQEKKHSKLHFLSNLDEKKPKLNAEVKIQMCVKKLCKLLMILFKTQTARNKHTLS